MTALEFHLAKEAVFRHAQHDEDLCYLLANAYGASQHLVLAEHIYHYYYPPNLPQQKPTSLVNEFMAWTGQSDISPFISPVLQAALVACSLEHGQYQVEKWALLVCTQLNPKALDWDYFLALVPTITCSQLSNPYPLPLLYVAETQAIHC